MLRKIIAASFLFTAALTITGCHGHRDLSDPKARAKISEKASHHLVDALEDLDASEAQLAALAGVEKPVLEEGFKFLDGNKAAKAALVEQWSAPKADAARVHALVDERVDGVRRVLHAAADAALKIQGELSAEQRAEVAARFEDRK